jgi:hypothetical protein
MRSKYAMNPSLPSGMTGLCWVYVVPTYFSTASRGLQSLNISA